MSKWSTKPPKRLRRADQWYVVYTPARRIICKLPDDAKHITEGAK